MEDFVMRKKERTVVATFKYGEWQQQLGERVSESERETEGQVTNF
jgi:hypothetical protein